MNYDAGILELFSEVFIKHIFIKHLISNYQYLNNTYHSIYDHLQLSQRGMDHTQLLNFRWYSNCCILHQRNKGNQYMDQLLIHNGNQYDQRYKCIEGIE